jgi:transcriptional regulator with XRE-family HTH domain
MDEKSIGKALADIRNLKRLKQRQVAESLKVHLSWVSAVENGRRTLDRETLRKLCDVLEVSMIDVTDMAYASFRDETFQYLRESGARLPDDEAVSLSDLQKRIKLFMKSLESLVDDSFRYVQQPSRMEILRTRLAATAPPLASPISPRRRGRPPGAVEPNPKKGKKGPAGKKG